MDPLLQEAYSTVITAVPYVVLAYLLIWLILFVLIVVSILKLNKIEKEVEVLEASIDRLESLKQSDKPLDENARK
ncbi:MAG: CcmD family protein [Coriobacteriia bacterium]|nr:CcmD family protein [Coriobacteriia bacterium]